MGEIARRVIVKCVTHGFLFNGHLSEELNTPHSFHTKYVSEIEKYDSLLVLPLVYLCKQLNSLVRSEPGSKTADECHCQISPENVFKQPSCWSLMLTTSITPSDPTLYYLLANGGIAAAAPPPFRPGNLALCGSRTLVTPYYCRLGDLLCFVFMSAQVYCMFDLSV